MNSFKLDFIFLINFFLNDKSKFSFWLPVQLQGITPYKNVSRKEAKNLKYRLIFRWKLSHFNSNKNYLLIL